MTLTSPLNATIDSILEPATRKICALYSRRPPDFFSQIDSLVSRCLNDLVDAAAQSGKPAVDFQKLSDHLADRRRSLPLRSGQSTEVIGICKQVLAFGIAAGALALPFLQQLGTLSLRTQKLVEVFGLFAVQIVLSSLGILVVHLLQSRFRYPFLALTNSGNAWPFFYYASTDPSTPRSLWNDKITRERSVKLYSQDLLQFAKRAILESPQERLRSEIQQYFLILSYQGYVNQFQLRTTNLFVYLFGSALLTFIVASFSLLVGAT